MLLDISAQERAFLSELLDAKQNSMLHEINHTDTHEFKTMLKQQLNLLDALKSKIERLDSSQQAPRPSDPICNTPSKAV